MRLGSGSPAAPCRANPPPKDRSAYGHALATGQADIFVTYCTNARQAKDEVASLQVVAIPDELAVGADYGLTVIAGARSDAERFAQFMLSRPGQAILAHHGFSTATPTKEPK